LSLFLERGVEPVAIEEVTRAAGVAKGSFYRYFEDKTHLVRSIVEPLAGAVRTAMTRTTSALAAAKTESALRSAYRTLAEELVPELLPKARVVRLYLQESRGPRSGARAPLRELSDEVFAHALVLTRAAHSHGLLRDLSPTVTATAVVGAVEALFFRFLEGENLGSPAEASEALISMVLQGLGTPRDELPARH